jgi:type III restriction enzyme
MSDLMEQTSPPMRLTRRTLLRIIKEAPDPQATVNSPHEFAAEAVKLIKTKMAEQIVDGIQYKPIDEWYQQELFDTKEVVPSWEDIVVPAERTLYDGVITDSQVERDFVVGLEARQDVRFYMKLPDWFKVSTPIGNYNPDWAIVLENPDDPQRPHLCFVTETKGGTDVSKLRFSHEKQKIHYGRRHFEQGLRIPYEVATSMSDIDPEKIAQRQERL